MNSNPNTLSLFWQGKSRFAALLTVCGGLISLFMVGCSEPPKPEVKPHEVTVMKIEPKDAPVQKKFVGITTSSQQVEVRARVDGFLDERVYTEGSIVKKGDLMFRIDPKPFQAQLDASKGALAEQKARLWTARANLKRVRPLVKAKAVSKKDLDDATGRVNTAAAAVEMANAEVETAQLNLGYTSIYAPVTGASSFARPQVGAYLDQQNSLLTYVAQLDPIWVDFSIAEDDMLRIRKNIASGRLEFPGEDKKLDIELVLADGSKYSETGKVFFTDATYSTNTGTFLIRATFANPDGLLRPGQFVRVIAKGAISPDAILVPQRAVFQGAKGFFVWIVDKENKAQVRNVEVGIWQEDNWFINKGLAKGETLIVDGLARLAQGTVVKTTPYTDKKPDDGNNDNKDSSTTKSD